MSKTKKQPLPCYYDEKAPACYGRWKVIHKGKNIVNIHSFHTEAEARKDAGLKGGSTDPRYRPEAT